MIDLKNTHCCPLSTTGAACAHFTPISQLSRDDIFALSVGQLQNVDGEWTAWISQTTNASPRQAIYMKGAEDNDNLWYAMKTKKIAARYH